MRDAGFIPVAEAASLARVSRSTVYRWVDKLNTRQAGPQESLFIERSSLLALLGPELCKAYELS